MTLALHGKSKRRQAGLLTAALMAVVLSAVAGVLWLGVAGAKVQPPAYSVHTSIQNITGSSTCPNGGGGGVDCNIYTAKTQVFLDGGPSSSFLPDAYYCFAVYNPNGGTLLSTDAPSARTFQVSGGNIIYSGGHATGLDSRNSPADVTIGFSPYNDTTNNGGEYKYTLYQYWPDAPVSDANPDCPGGSAQSKTDNFKIGTGGTIQVQKLSATGTHPAASFNIQVGSLNFNGVSLLQNATSSAVSAGQTLPLSQTPAAVGESAPPANWSLTATPFLVKSNSNGNAVCSGTEGGYTASATVPADGNDYVVCVVNQYTPPATSGTLTVRKVGNFSAGLVVGGFSGPVTGPNSYSSTWNADIDGQDQKTVTAGTGYSVSETTTGFPLNVTGGTVTGAQYKVLASATDQCGTTGFTSTAPTNLAVSVGGETVVCVLNAFTATQVTNGTIIVKKVVSGSASSADDVFGGTLNSQVTDAVVKTFSDLSQNGPKTYTDIVPGTYYATETNTNGYTLQGYAVGNSDHICPASPTSTTATDVAVTVIAGSVKTLCIYNEKNVQADKGTIIVKKVVSGSASSASDQFGGTVNSQVSGTVHTFTDLSQNGPKTYTDILPGTYYANETNANGYTLLGYAVGNSDHICPEGPTSTTATAVTVTVTAASTKTLCIYNEKQVQTRTIRIGKVTLTGTHPQQTFTGTIAPGTPGTFSVNLPANQAAGSPVPYLMDNQNGQVVTETNIPANWTVDGYAVRADGDGKGSCSPTDNYVGSSASVPAGSGTYLVCIRNTYTPPSTPTPTPTTPFNPCPFGCVPVILTTPTPTPPPPTPTVVPPTPTVVPPAATPTKTPVEAVEGAKTPGAIATPLAPSTGSGLGDGGSSTNLFLALIGILSLSGGLALLGYGRRAR